jgi:hypothetical protein
MNQKIGRIAATLALVAVVAGSAFATPQGKMKKAPATCPVCHMALSAKKTKDNTVAVKVGGKTMYCCSKCDMKKKH